MTWKIKIREDVSSSLAVQIPRIILFLHPPLPINEIMMTKIVKKVTMATSNKKSNKSTILWWKRKKIFNRVQKINNPQIIINSRVNKTNLVSLLMQIQTLILRHLLSHLLAIFQMYPTQIILKIIFLPPLFSSRSMRIRRDIQVLHSQILILQILIIVLVVRMKLEKA